MGPGIVLLITVQSHARAAVTSVSLEQKRYRRRKRRNAEKRRNTEERGTSPRWRCPNWKLITKTNAQRKLKKRQSTHRSDKGSIKGGGRYLKRHTEECLGAAEV